MTGKDKHPDLELLLKIEDISKITKCIKKINKYIKYHSKMHMK